MGDIPHSETATKTPRPLYVSRNHHQERNGIAQFFREQPKRVFWKERTKPERAMLIILLIAVIIIFALSITIDVLKRRDLKREARKFCLSKDCITTASYLLNSLDVSQNPCEDFYEFACGKFIEQAIVPEKSSSKIEEWDRGVSIFTKNLETFQAQANSLMEKHNASDDPKSLWKARAYYESCIDEDKIEELGIEPMQEIIHNLGGWPVLGHDWDDEQFNWTEWTFKFTSKGFGSSQFISLNVYPDDRNEDVNIIHLDKPYLGFPNERNSYGTSLSLENNRVENYYHYMVNTSVFFGGNRTVAENEMKKVLEFEIFIIELKNKENPLEHSLKLPINQIKKMIPNLNWLYYIGKIVPFKISGEDNLYIESPGFIKKMLEKIETTSKRVLANYMMWHAVRDHLYLLNQKAIELRAKFNPDKFSDEDQPRWLNCLGQVWQQMITPAAMYVRRYRNPDDKERVKEIFSIIREELQDVIKNFPGMKEALKKEAQETLSSMNYFVFPDEFLDDNSLDSYYQDLHFNPGEYFHNVLTMKKFLRNAQLKEIHHVPGKPHWANVRYALHVSEYFPAFDKTVEIPFTMLVGYDFESSRPRYINYATLGAFIGNIMITIFSDEVQDQLFPERDKCTVVQISNRVVPGSPMGIVETIGSLKLIYKAYQKWVKNNDEEKPLPGFQFTPNQLFWIADAITACGKYPSDSTMRQYSKSRVNGPLSSLPEFAVDFNCPAGSQMNPEEKCHVW